MEKILVAEDSYALANLLDFVLSHSGFDVSLYHTGLAACEAAAAQKFDLILLDQQMPEMTGMEVLTNLRASGPNQDTPVFLCTAKTHELNLELVGSSLKVNGVFQKPFSPKDLVAQLKSVCQATHCS